jgi:hypothetical protein
LPSEFVDVSYEEKYRKRHDHEANDGIDEKTIVDRNRPRLLRIGKSGKWPCNRTLLDDYEEVGEINVAEQKPNRWHNDIGHERFYDGTEGCADYDSDSHINHIASHGKFFEFL